MENAFSLNAVPNPLKKKADEAGFLNPDNIVAQLNVQEGMKIADFGCGTGHFTIALAKKAGKDGRVSAIDIQNEPLESVKMKAQAAGIENVDIIRANLEILGGTKLAEASQDFVFVANVLFQSPKKEDVIKEAKRIIKEGGTLFAVEWKKGEGGFGPPDSLRIDEEGLKNMIRDEGFTFERAIDAGQFHFGLVFKK